MPSARDLFKRLRVLVLEHHDVQRALTVKTLLGSGSIDVLQAADGQGALALLQRHGGVDIALCDIQTLVVDGLAFLSCVSEARLVSGVIICSAMPGELVHAVEQIVRLQGLELLGHAGKPARAQVLNPLLQAYRANSRPRIARPSVAPDQPGAEEIHRGINRQEFCAWFQPKFHLSNGLIQGAEVLLRWQRSPGEVWSPATFLPAVEQYGLLDTIFFSLFEQGLRLQRHMCSAGNGFKLAFNLEASQLACPHFVDRIRDMLSAHGASPASVTFELTETGLLQAPGMCITNMVRLRMLGCDLSIDDFGVGYSSLERLCQLPFNEVKLDAGFIRDFKQPRSGAVISAVLGLARGLNMRVVAEGIETIEQLRSLQSLGCHLGQGYLYARPMSEAHMTNWAFTGDPALWRTAVSPAG